MIGADAWASPPPSRLAGSRDPAARRNSPACLGAFDRLGAFADATRMEQRITGEIRQAVAADEKYQNAKKNSDRQNATIEHDKALKRVITALFKDDAKLFKQSQDNESFRSWLTDTVFGMTDEQ
jgi:type I restriction enzyme, R subunit